RQGVRHALQPQDQGRRTAVVPVERYIPERGRQKPLCDAIEELDRIVVDRLAELLALALKEDRFTERAIGLSLRVLRGARMTGEVQEEPVPLKALCLIRLKEKVRFQGNQPAEDQVVAYGPWNQEQSRDQQC